MIETFKQFLQDNNAWDMYITGRAGTGKTTKMAELVEALGSREYTVCAYTHKACGILREKMPEGTKIQTLHSFLKKRPTINPEATKLKHVQSNKVMGVSDKVHIMFIDEYSMIGEQDLMDIRALQDEDYDGKPELKIVWIGDPHQLPPVGDMFTLKPYGDYQVTLTHIYRQTKDNPLSAPLEQLVSFIEGATPEPLIESSNFIRGIDIADPTLERAADSITLAYTNRRVQEINALMQGRDLPELNDIVFSPTTKQQYIIDFIGDASDIHDAIDLPHNGKELGFNTKFKTLEYLLSMDDIQYALCRDPITEEHYTYAYVFGHQNYLDLHKHYKQLAAQSNVDIEREFPGFKAAGWAKANWTHPLARARSKAWRDFLTFDECVICLDFAHAMTVHKSQGSTYDTVYLDTHDIGSAADRDYNLYLKLMYVGMSRASNMVVTN